MLGIDKGGSTAHFLGFSHNMLGKSRFTATLWAIDFDNTATRQTADTSRRVLASPIFIIEPLPNLRSIWLIAALSAFSFSGEIAIVCVPPLLVATRNTPYILVL